MPKKAQYLDLRRSSSQPDVDEILRDRFQVWPSTPPLGENTGFIHALSSFFSLSGFDAREQT